MGDRHRCAWRFSPGGINRGQKGKYRGKPLRAWQTNARICFYAIRKKMTWHVLLRGKSPFWSTREWPLSITWRRQKFVLVHSLAVQRSI